MSEKHYFSEMDSLHAYPVLGCISYCLGVAAFLAVLMLLCSCKTQYVPVESVRTEYVTNTVHDSVVVNVEKTDSIVVREKGDTVFVERFRTEWRDRWHETLRTDTVLKVDSVQVPYPVEKKVPVWERVKTGAVGFVVGLVFVGGVALWIRRRYKRT